MKYYIQLMRPKHYLKNILIFFPIIFSGQIFDLGLELRMAIGLISFCCIASVVYILNDISDYEYDKVHSTKRNRPIASGKIGRKEAYIFSIMLAVVAYLLNSILLKNSIATMVLTFYLLINIAYSIGKLKQVAIIDVVILMSGFLIRVIYGAVICGIPVSNWLYLTVVSVSFYMGLGKRRNEKLREKELTRVVLHTYTKDFLDKSMNMCLTLAIVFYSLWCVSPDTILRHHSENIIITVPIVIVLAMKYSLDIEQSESDGDPIEVILKDKVLIILGIMYSIIMFGIIYG